MTGKIKAIELQKPPNLRCWKQKKHVYLS